MDVKIRCISNNELDIFLSAVGIPFGFSATPEIVEKYGHILDLNRCYAAFDKNNMVATFGSFLFEMNVPGGTAVTSGVSLVTVQPTHRRQGILKSFIIQHFNSACEQGEILSVLWTTESGIYSRFGYAPASDRIKITLQKVYAHMKRPIDISGTLRFVEKQEALSILPDIFSAALKKTPGVFTRDNNWWRYLILENPFDHLKGISSRQVVVHQGEKGPDGYVIYTTHKNKEDYYSHLQVFELIGIHPEAEKNLWQYLFDIDLIDTILASNRPVDDPLGWWLKEPRNMQRCFTDALWVRIIDVASALNSRKYTRSGYVAFRYIDDLCPWNNGVYSLEVDSRGIGVCRITASPPDFEISAYGLSLVYLGGRRFSEIARAGIISGTQQMLEKLDAMFYWNSLPWCNEQF